jgi:polyribonucleotide 5'-hydroxyl-kinase
MLASFLPGGEEDENTEFPLFDPVTPSSQLLHCILAVLYATPHDSQDTIRDANVMGFVYVAEVDEKKQRLRILAPLSGKLGDRPMVWGSWPEAAVSLIG